MSEMIERVAKAMAAAEGWRWDDGLQMLDRAAAGLQNTSRERDTWRNRARAAIEAMREPTEAMAMAAEEANLEGGIELASFDGISPSTEYLDKNAARQAFRAMIDAALKP